MADFNGIGFSGYQQMDNHSAMNYDMNFNYDDQESQQSNMGNYHGGAMQSEYDFGNYYNDNNDLVDGDNRKYQRAGTELNFPDNGYADDMMYTSMGPQYQDDTMQPASERADNQLGETFEANDLQNILRNTEIKESEAGGSSGDGKSSMETSQAKTRQIKNNIGTLKSNNERFLFLFREAIKRFRIPQYGFNEMHGISK